MQKDTENKPGQIDVIAISQSPRRSRRIKKNDNSKKPIETAVIKVRNIELKFALSNFVFSVHLCNANLFQKNSKPKRVHFGTEDAQSFDNSSQSKRPIRRKLSPSENIRLGAPDNEFVANEIVLAAVSGYAPWPARIIEIIGETIRVEFFGTGEMWVLYLPCLFYSYFISALYHYSFNSFFSNPLRSHAVSHFELNRTIPFIGRKGYRKATREVESVLGIPKEFSIFE